MGNVTEYTDPAGNKTVYQYTALDQLSKVSAPDGSVTEYTYDASARPYQVTSNQGGVRPTSTTMPA